MMMMNECTLMWHKS